jgi:hypothetical protein
MTTYNRYYCRSCRHRLTDNEIAAAALLGKCPECNSLLVIGDANASISRSKDSMLAGMVGMALGAGGVFAVLYMLDLNVMPWSLVPMLFIGSWLALYFQKQHTESTLKDVREYLEDEGKIH